MACLGCYGRCTGNSRISCMGMHDMHTSPASSALLPLALFAGGSSLTAAAVSPSEPLLLRLDIDVFARPRS